MHGDAESAVDVRSGRAVMARALGVRAAARASRLRSKLGCACGLAGSFGRGGW